MTDDGVALTSIPHPRLSEDNLETITIEVRGPRCEMTIPWSSEEGRPHRVSFHPKGYRDVMWCPYLNEPAILEWRDGKPHCPNCNGHFEGATHLFICHIEKK